jgi:hypothetical protein
VSDAIIVARSGVPAVALITDRFVDQGHMVAAARGMPDLPQVRLPYPVAGTGREAVERAAGDAIPAILEALGLTVVP